MTLCMAAISQQGEDSCLVFGADRRVEVGWAGGDIAFKLSWASHNWPAMVAGDVSKALDLLTTFQQHLTDGKFNARNTFDRLNAAASEHKKKLCERLVAQKLGITLERFLQDGEKELTPEIRHRTLLQLEELDFDCEVIVSGFIGKAPYLFTVDSVGEVIRHQNFAAIGTGSVIARSNLYYRQQAWTNPVETTLYNLYESSQLATIAPGVGKISEFLIMKPSKDNYEDKELEARRTNVAYQKLMEKSFKRFGPKPLKELYVLQPEHLRRLGKKAREAEMAAQKQITEGTTPQN